jgi:hypothetical protein
VAHTVISSNYEIFNFSSLTRKYQDLFVSMVYGTHGQPNQILISLICLCILPLLPILLGYLHLSVCAQLVACTARAHEKHEEYRL